MTVDFSDARVHAILDGLPSMWVALSSTLPSNAGNGSNITEPAVAEYVRASLSLAAASSRQRVSNALLDFVSGGAVATNAAGNFGFYAVMTASSGGVMVCRGRLSAPIAWVAGVNIRIASGNLTIRLPGV
jgi:hypothetical protein